MDFGIGQVTYGKSSRGHCRILYRRIENFTDVRIYFDLRRKARMYELFTQRMKLVYVKRKERKIKALIDRGDRVNDEI